MRKGGEDKTIAYGALKRRFGWEYDGMVLHELYFQNLGREKDLSSKSLLYQKSLKILVHLKIGVRTFGNGDDTWHWLGDPLSRFNKWNSS